MLKLGKCWVLGDKLGCPTFCRKVATVLNEHLYENKVMSVEFAEFAFAKSGKGSELRRLAIIHFIKDMIRHDAREWYTGWLDRPEQADAFSAELVRLMPTMTHYLSLWCSDGGNYLKGGLKAYLEIFQVLLERDPTEADISSFSKQHLAYWGDGWD